MNNVYRYGAIAKWFFSVSKRVKSTQSFPVSCFLLVFWFLPALIAFFLNRKHFGKILVANVPAGLSWLAWFALLAWAVTGKIRSKKGEVSECAGVQGERPAAGKPISK
ncbi:superinfection immunity protein [Microbulbifer sp. MKSA007]|uniref:superinfection immunity protein n=1 Tax=Microbulbifer sp. SSSA008 TaxID=3243380 RepID=UPI002B2BE1BF|nr:superinfection immunity protein [Microbulbifer sp. MKSA007]